MEEETKQLTLEERQVIEKQKELWRQKHGMTDEDFEKFISSPGHMRLALRTGEMRKYKLIAEVVKSKYCNAGLKVGQKYTFSVMPSQLLVEESDAPFCIKALGPMGQIMLVFWDSLAAGVDPNDGMWTHVQCLDPGVERGGLGNVLFKVHAEKIE